MAAAVPQGGLLGCGRAVGAAGLGEGRGDVGPGSGEVPRRCLLVWLAPARSSARAGRRWRPAPGCRRRPAGPWACSRWRPAVGRCSARPAPRPARGPGSDGVPSAPEPRACGAVRPGPGLATTIAAPTPPTSPGSATAGTQTHACDHLRRTPSRPSPLAPAGTGRLGVPGRASERATARASAVGRPWHVGLSLVERARSGFERRLIVDHRGAPLAVMLTGGDRHDVTWSVADDRAPARETRGRSSDRAS